MNVPVPIRLSSIEAWQRFADVGGFDPLTENGSPVSQIPFGGVGNGARLQQGQAARLREAYRRHRIDDERTQDIVQRLEAGETLEQASKPWGITGERTRQIAERYFSLNDTSLREIRQAQKEKKHAEEAFEQLVHAPLCCVCNEPVLRTSHKRTCSPGCGELFRRYPWRYDEAKRKAVRLANARHALAHPAGKTASLLAYAERVIADPDMPFNRRYRHHSEGDIDRAVSLLRQALEAGPRPGRDVVAELAADGVSGPLVEASCRRLDVRRRNRGFGPGHWADWSLPSALPVLVEEVS